jgi:3-hydroxybutyryl-CoA dehydrogenase
VSESIEHALPLTVAVVGLGLLGRGIATCFLGNGFRVIGCDRSSKSHQNANQYIERGIQEMVQYGGTEIELAQSWRDRYLSTQSYEDWPPCDFVVESIDEDPEAKQAVFEQIERVVAPDVPIGSNTSSIPITQLQQSRHQPQRLLGMHWFEPAHATRFIELIPGEYTSNETMLLAAMIARRCGKEPSTLSKDIPGFIVNRLAYAMYREALNLVELGVADVATIDRSFRNACGVWSTICGPFQWIDLTGGPGLYGKAMQRVLPSLSNATDLPDSMRQLMETGADGITSGHGFYNYTPQQAKVVEELFQAHAWRAKQLMDKYYPVSGS